MNTTNFENRLLTPELTEALSSYPLYSQDAKKKDAMCIAVFYLGNIPGTSWKDSRRAMTSHSMASLLDCKKRSTATSLQSKWQASPMMQASTDLAL